MTRIDVLEEDIVLGAEEDFGDYGAGLTDAPHRTSMKGFSAIEEEPPYRAVDLGRSQWREFGPGGWEYVAYAPDAEEPWGRAAVEEVQRGMFVPVLEVGGEQVSATQSSYPSLDRARLAAMALLAGRTDDPMALMPHALDEIRRDPYGEEFERERGDAWRAARARAAGVGRGGTDRGELQSGAWRAEPAILLGGEPDDEWGWEIEPSGRAALWDGEGREHIRIFPERMEIRHNGSALPGKTDWTADSDDVRLALEAYVAREEGLPYDPPEGVSWDRLIYETTHDLEVYYGKRGPELVRPQWPKGSYLNYEQELDEVLNSPDGFHAQDSVYVCDTPAILLAMGMEQRPVLLSKNKISKLVANKSAINEHWHGLGREDLLRIPEYMAAPAIILDTLSTSSRDDAIVVVFAAVDIDDLPLIAAIQPNGRAEYEFEPLDSNRLLSVYGRSNLEGYLQRAVEEGKLLYVDKEKTEELEVKSQLHLLRATAGLPFNQIIHQSTVIEKAEGRSGGVLAGAAAFAASRLARFAGPEAMADIGASMAGAPAVPPPEAPEGSQVQGPSSPGPSADSGGAGASSQLVQTDGERVTYRLGQATDFRAPKPASGAGATPAQDRRAARDAAAALKKDQPGLRMQRRQ